MKRKFKATIYYMVDKEHPDYEYFDNPEQQQEFSDVYIIDMDYFDNDMNLITDYIKHDLSIVAGGGYSTDHIYDVTYTIRKGANK